MTNDYYYRPALNKENETRKTKTVVTPILDAWKLLFKFKPVSTNK